MTRPPPLELFRKFIRFYIVNLPLSTYQECLIDKGDISSFSIRAKVTKSVGDETIEVIEWGVGRDKNKTEVEDIPLHFFSEMKFQETQITYLKKGNISPLCHCEIYFCWVLIKRVFCYKFKQVDKPLCGHMNTFLLVKTLYQHYSWICGYLNIWIFEFLPPDIWIHGIIRLVLCPPSWQSRQIVGRRQQREMGRS